MAKANLLFSQLTQSSLSVVHQTRYLDRDTNNICFILTFTNGICCIYRGLTEKNILCIMTILDILFRSLYTQYNNTFLCLYRMPTSLLLQFSNLLFFVSYIICDCLLKAWSDWVDLLSCEIFFIPLLYKKLMQ